MQYIAIRQRDIENRCVTAQCRVYRKFDPFRQGPQARVGNAVHREVTRHHRITVQRERDAEGNAEFSFQRCRRDRLADKLGADFRNLAMDRHDFPPGHGVAQFSGGVDMGMDQLAASVRLVGIVEQALTGGEFQTVEAE